MVNIRCFLSSFSNQDGVTFIEVVMAALLLTFFVSGFFFAFVESKKVLRVGDVSINATAVAGNVLEMLKQKQGANSYYGDIFSEGTQTFKSNLDGDVAFLNNLDTSIGHNIKFQKQEYQVETYQSSTGRSREDGFKKITVILEYEDLAQNIH